MRVESVIPPDASFGSPPSSFAMTYDEMAEGQAKRMVSVSRSIFGISKKKRMGREVRGRKKTLSNEEMKEG